MMPTTGSLADNFELTVIAANATTCTMSIDGAVPTSETCNFAMDTIGQFYGVGTHIALIMADDGQGGVTTCQTTWTVTN